MGHENLNLVSWPEDLQRVQELVGRTLYKDTVFINVANLISTMGTCPRKHVGAVIVRDGRCVSWGFNGAPPGLPHCEENGHGYLIEENSVLWLAEDSNKDNWWEPQNPKRSAEEAASRLGCRNATHAEANALAFAARQGISTDHATCFVTVSPCDTCARLLIAAGIERVVYAEEYRDPSGVNLLREAGVKVG